MLPGAFARSAGVIRWGHVLATPARPGCPAGRRAEAAGRPAAGARGGPGGGEPAAAGGERPPQEAAEAAEAGAGRHGPGGRGAPAAPKRPRLAPGGMDRAAGARRRRRTGRGGRRTPPATEERVLTVAAPPGSRRKGYEPYTIQDLVLSSRVVRYRRERWLTPDGRELVAPLPPEVAGHFGPRRGRHIPMQPVPRPVAAQRPPGPP